MKKINKKINKKSLTVIPLAIAALCISSSVVAGDSVAGKAIYDSKGACATCHGAAGAGDGPAAVALDPKPTNFTTANFRLDTDGDGQLGSLADITNVIKYGAVKYGGNASMPGRADFSDAEIADLSAYVASLKK